MARLRQVERQVLSAHVYHVAIGTFICGDLVILTVMVRVAANSPYAYVRWVRSGHHVNDVESVPNAATIGVQVAYLDSPGET